MIREITWITSPHGGRAVRKTSNGWEPYKATIKRRCLICHRHFKLGAAKFSVCQSCESNARANTEGQHDCRYPACLSLTTGVFCLTHRGKYQSYKRSHTARRRHMTPVQWAQWHWRLTA
jgi:hypothetical protein